IGPEYTHAITSIDIAGSAFQELGVRLPPVRLVPVHDLEPRQFRVRIGRRGRTWLGPDPGTSSESVADVVSSAIMADVRQNAASLIDVDGVEHEMALLAGRFPVLVAAAMERASTTHLT